MALKVIKGWEYFGPLSLFIYLYEFSPGFSILLHLSESQRVQDASNNQDTASNPSYEQRRAKTISAKRNETMQVPYKNNVEGIKTQAKHFTCILTWVSPHSSSSRPMCLLHILSCRCCRWKSWNWSQTDGCRWKLLRHHTHLINRYQRCRNTWFLYLPEKKTAAKLNTMTMMSQRVEVHKLRADGFTAIISLLGFSLVWHAARFLWIVVICGPTSDDEHDAGAKAHLGLGGVLQGAHCEAAEGEYWHKFSKDTQHHTNSHQGLHHMQGTWTENTRLVLLSKNPHNYLVPSRTKKPALQITLPRLISNPNYRNPLQFAADTVTIWINVLVLHCWKLPFLSVCLWSDNSVD